MADQREAIRQATYINDTWTHKPTGMDEITLNLARAVIALDEECRRLRGEAERHIHQCICIECGLNVKADEDLCCVTCGRDVLAVTHGQVWPDSFRRVVDGWLESRRCDDELAHAAQPAPSSPGVSDPSEADVEAVARYLAAWESGTYDDMDESMQRIMRDAAEQAIRLGARVPR